MTLRVLMTGLTVTAVLAAAAPSEAQLGDRFKSALKKADEFNISEQEEVTLGADISERLRDKYGVVQDRAVHKYVTLVGSVLASASARPNLKWTFIVLDTDGVNAFAAPGGFVHITRGALALIRSEAELADVLGHEIGHITERHTLNAIKKAKVSAAVANASKSERLKEAANQAYAMILENSFDRGDEMAADKVGVTVADKSGYAPTELSAFLTRLTERNKNLKERSGMFASHPESKARIDAMIKVISSAKLTASALVAPRYASSIAFEPVPVTAVAQVSDGSAAPAAGTSQSGSGGGRLGLSGSGVLGRERSSSESVSSAGSRGLNPDRDAKGGPNKSTVTVSVTASEVAEFRKGITS